MSSEIKPIGDVENRVRLADVVPLDTPFSVYVYPTTFCNFKCLYCAHSLGTEGMKKQYGFVKEEMSMETFRRTLDQLCGFPRKIKVLSLTGQGEPLLNHNIPEMIRLAKASGCFERVEIISNGALLTPELSDLLVENGLDVLRVSLQGLSSDKYSKMCGVRVDFDVFMKNICYLHSHCGKTQLFVKVLDAALDEGDDEKFYELFESCSDRMFIEKMHATYEGVELTDGLENSYDRYGRRINERNVCPLAFFMLGIYPNGDVQPCDTLYRPVILGNVHDGSICDMWQGKRLKTFWEIQLQGKRMENPGCVRCCAPNDVSHPEDVLDDDIVQILARIDSLQ